MNMGYSTKGLLAILLLLQFGLCSFTIIGLWCGSIKGFFILLGALCVVTAFFVVIHYTHRAVLRKQRSILSEKVEISPTNEKDNS